MNLADGFISFPPSFIDPSSSSSSSSSSARPPTAPAQGVQFDESGHGGDEREEARGGRGRGGTSQRSRLQRKARTGALVARTSISVSLSQGKAPPARSSLGSSEGTGSGEGREGIEGKEAEAAVMVRRMSSSTSTFSATNDDDNGDAFTDSCSECENGEMNVRVGMRGLTGGITAPADALVFFTPGSSLHTFQPHPTTTAVGSTAGKGCSTSTTAAAVAVAAAGAAVATGTNCGACAYTSFPLFFTMIQVSGERGRCFGRTMCTACGVVCVCMH
jgi:hypothetical protein